MKYDFLKKLTVTLSFSLIFCGSIAAQKQEQRGADKAKTADVYVISAKAGGVNYVSGLTEVERQATKKIEILAKSDELSDKDKVVTGDSGKVEILLNPGSFLRLAENSKIEFTNTALDSLQIKLIEGAALFEASAVGDEGAEIIVSTAHASVRLEKAGVYRLNVKPTATEIWVWKGAASVGENVIKGGRKAVYQNGLLTTEVAKFEKDASRDEFDIWSKERAKELAKINERLERRALARAFSGFSRVGFNDRFNSGFWVYDRVSRGSCFVPSGWNYWNSPYGYGYNRGISWGYGQQPVVVNPQSSQTFQNPQNPNVSSSPTAGFPQGHSPSGSPSAATPSAAAPTELRRPSSPISSKNAPINPH